MVYTYEKTKFQLGPDEHSLDPATLADIMESQLKVPLVEGIALSISEAEIVIKSLRLLAETEQNDYLA